MDGKEKEMREGFFWYYRERNRARPGKVLCSDYVSTFIQSLDCSVSDTWSIVQSTTDQNKTAVLEYLGISLVSFQCCLYNQVITWKHKLTAWFHAFSHKEPETLNSDVNFFSAETLLLSNFPFVKIKRKKEKALI